MELVINDFPIKKISKEELSRYIGMAFNSPKYKEILNRSMNMNEAFQSYQALGLYLTTYAVASMDLSSASVDFILDRFLKHREEIKLQNKNYSLTDSNKKIFFEKEILPCLTQIWKAKLSLEGHMKLNDILKIEEAIYLQCKNNQYYTHSFNGALVKDVEKNGLNINSEFFQKEYQDLSKLSGDTSFKKGCLCYCEMSEGSFGYAVYSPERLHMILDHYSLKQKNDETIYEYYERCLHYKMENNEHNLTEMEKIEIEASAHKIFAFYLGQGKSAMAIIERDSEIKDTTLTKRSMYTDFLELKWKLRRVMRNDEELNILYEKVKQLFLEGKDSSILELENFIQLYQCKYPNKTDMQEFITGHFSRTLMEICLNNYLYAGFGDGYTAPNGVIERDEFALVTFDNPCDLYAKHRKAILTEVEKQVGMQITPYKMVVDVEKYRGIPYPVLKTSRELIDEKDIIIKKIEDLNNEGKLAHEILEQMLEALYDWYQEVEKNAPIEELNRVDSFSVYQERLYTDTEEKEEVFKKR